MNHTPNSDDMRRAIARAIAESEQRQTAKLRAVLLSVAQQCGGPVQFAVRRIVEEM